MKLHDDLDEFRVNVQTSWCAYAWLLAIFSAIALGGWLAGQYLR